MAASNEDVDLVRTLLAQDSIWTSQGDGKMWSQLKRVAAALESHPEARRRLYGSVNGESANARLIPVVASALGIRPDAIKEHRVSLPDQPTTKNAKGVFFRPLTHAKTTSAARKRPDRVAPPPAPAAPCAPTTAEAKFLDRIALHLHDKHGSSLLSAVGEKVPRPPRVSKMLKQLLALQPERFVVEGQVVRLIAPTHAAASTPRAVEEEYAARLLQRLQAGAGEVFLSTLGSLVPKPECLKHRALKSIIESHREMFSLERGACEAWVVRSAAANQQEPEPGLATKAHMAGISQSSSAVVPEAAPQQLSLERGTKMLQEELLDDVAQTLSRAHLEANPKRLTEEERRALKAEIRKVQVSRDSYVAQELRECDAQGFMAAGALLWSRKGTALRGRAHVLMAMEQRSTSLPPQLNFIGGKRDALSESARQTAAREVMEETGGLISQATRRAILAATGPVLWDSGGKYAAFVVEASAEDANVPQRLKDRGGPPDPLDASLKEVRWVPLSDLLNDSWCRAQMAEYHCRPLRMLWPHLRSLLKKLER
mmetsp:Transcript_45164/g.112313  ORF Transcript_45164/g.112313 Transcript_45164/m.112313 type:complete len:541 (+) Transcript_45164:56-1678(+)